MKTMRNTIIAIAKSSTNYNDFTDKIYALGTYVMISDIDDNVVDYLDNKNIWHSVDVSKYTANLD